MKPWMSAEPGSELLRELGAVALTVSGTSLMLLSVYLFAAAMYRVFDPGAAAQGRRPRAVALVGPLFALASGFSAAGYVGAVWPDGNLLGIGFVAVVGVVVALILLAALSGGRPCGFA